MDQRTILAQAEQVHKQYQRAGGAVQALQRIELTIHAGELVALVGPTGSGKTTLLMLLAGLDRPDAGTITLQGQALHTLSADALTDLRSRAVGVVYQQYNLFPGFTVRDNIALPLRLMADPPYAATARVHELISTLGLDAIADRYPAELSGGQQQLVAVARALAAKPPLLLADEPTANLDSTTARKIVAQLCALADSGAHGVLLATHDLRTASQADRVLTLRDGQIVKETVLGTGRSTREVLAKLA
jgi:ABC-type lipoprotein export system ATPase subunit